LNLRNHNNTFQEIIIKKGTFDLKTSEITNKKRFFIPQNNEYNLLFNNDKPIIDIALEWTSPQKESTTIVSFPYTHKNVFGLRSFGGLLKASKSIISLKNSKELSFFFDEERKKIYVKLFNRKNHNKITIYASDYQEGKFPYKVTRNKKKEKLIVTYKIEKKAFTSLFIKDINGKTIKSLVNGSQKRKSVEASIDIDQLNLKNELRFYELTIDGKLYRAPLFIAQ